MLYMPPCEPAAYSSDGSVGPDYTFVNIVKMAHDPVGRSPQKQAKPGDVGFSLFLFMGLTCALSLLLWLWRIGLLPAVPLEKQPTMESWHFPGSTFMALGDASIFRVCIPKYTSVRNHLNFLIAPARFFVPVLSVATTMAGNKRRRDAGGDARISSRWVDDGHW